MSANSKIEWTDHTMNPWIGCTKVSPGCLNCYAETLMDKRYHRVSWGKGNLRKRTSAANWKEPLKWNTQAMPLDAEGKPRRARVFCASLADWLDEEVPLQWLADLLALIQATPNLDWLLLSKRPENWKKLIERVVGLSCLTGCLHTDPHGIAGWLANRWQHGDPPANVWVGTSVEDQTRADERTPLLLQIPAKVRFLSCEPLLGPVDLRQAHRAPIKLPSVDWVICGGESGPGARTMHADWARSLRDQCKEKSVPFFMKQMDKKEPIPSDLFIRECPNSERRATP